MSASFCCNGTEIELLEFDGILINSRELCKQDVNAVVMGRINIAVINPQVAKLFLAEDKPKLNIVKCLYMDIVKCLYMGSCLSKYGYEHFWLFLEEDTNKIALGMSVCNNDNLVLYHSNIFYIDECLYPLLTPILINSIINH